MRDEFSSNLNSLHLTKILTAAPRAANRAGVARGWLASR